jgi:hypothetical protein
MKILLVVAVAAAALLVGTSRDEKANAQYSSSEWEQRVAQVDAYLDEGLTSETHETIAGPARDGADAAADFGDRLSTILQ